MRFLPTQRGVQRNSFSPLDNNYNIYYDIVFYNKQRDNGNTVII